MDEWLEIRQKVLVEGVSKREMLRRTGMHWKTREKILHHSVAPGYRRTKLAAEPRIGPYLEKIRAIQAAFRALPPVRFAACRAQSTIVNSEALVRFDTNDYSVPVAHGYHPVVVRGYVDRVEIGCGRQIIARRERCWESQRQVFGATHYLGLLSVAPGY